MLGAIIGDMVGSIYEFAPIKRKEFNIYNPRMEMTDDSLLTIAIAKVLLKHYPIDYSSESLKKIQQDLYKEFADTWKKYPGAGWGGRFYDWCYEVNNGKEPKPYHSCGNGSAMRISSVSYIANSEEELKLLSKTVTEITHDHPEGLKGAEAVAMCIYLALHGSSIEEIKNRMIKEYYPEIANYDFSNLVKTYRFSEICQESVPQAIYCFLVSNSLEDAIRNCVAIGGDCDTTGSMAGAIAEAYYQKDKVSDLEFNYMTKMMKKEVVDLVLELHDKIGSKKFKGSK